MMHRYFIDGDLSLEKIRISGAEAHHLIHVMRTSLGETVELFDGKGGVVQGTVVELNRKDAVIVAESMIQTTQPAGPILIVAVPKGDRFRWLVEKATELGVSRLIPVTTELSVVTPRESKIAKQEQAVIAACKQSGRNWLMLVDAVQSLDEAMVATQEAKLKYVAHPQGVGVPLGQVASDESPVFAIGPEAGFTESEVERLESDGYQRIRLGASILRIETAAIALAGWWSVSCFTQPE